MRAGGGLPLAQIASFDFLNPLIWVVASSFHGLVSDWFLPGVAPTGKSVEVAVFVGAIPCGRPSGQSGSEKGGHKARPKARPYATALPFKFEDAPD
jgi:hypothetical protein